MRSGKRVSGEVRGQHSRDLGLPRDKTEGPHDGFDRLLMGESGGIDFDIGGLFVDRKAGFQQGIKCGSGILDLKKRPLSIAGSPFEENFRIGMEPDRGADLAQDLPVFGPQDGPTARGQNDGVGADQALQGLGLALPEAFLAFLGENVTDTPSFRGLDDQLIAIEECVSKPCGQPPADAAFAAAHEADEDDVAGHVRYRNAHGHP